MAGEIYIADKTTLDAVKQDTVNILDNFPINTGIKSVQRGILQLPTGQKTVLIPIQSVDMSKSFVVLTNYFSGGSNETAMSVYLQSETNIRIDSWISFPARPLSWQVIEFN